MELRVLLQDVKKIEAEALVVGCFEDVRPLKGAAGELDWLLCGGLSRLIIAGRFTGALGDTVLTTPRGKIKVGKLFMVGRGPRGTDPEETARAFSRAVAKALLDAGVTSPVIEYAPPAGADEGRHLRAVRDGLREGSEGRGLTVQLLVRDALVYERISRMLNA